MIVYLYFNTSVHFKGFVLSCSCILCAQTFDHSGFYLRSHAQMSNNDKLKLKRMQISTLKSLVYWLVLHSSMPAGLFIAEILQAYLFWPARGKYYGFIRETLLHSVDFSILRICGPLHCGWPLSSVFPNSTGLLCLLRWL